MARDLDVEAILVRRRDIAAEIEQLRAEDGELETAIRVLQRFGNNTAKGKVPGHAVLVIKIGKPRPANLPTLFEMTETVLRDAIAAGKRGLKGREIVAEIEKRYWPGVVSHQILPLIYHFAKKERLLKGKDGIFRPVD